MQCLCNAHLSFSGSLQQKGTRSCPVRLSPPNHTINGRERLLGGGPAARQRSPQHELPRATAASGLTGRRRRRAPRPPRSGGRRAHSAIPPTRTPGPTPKWGLGMSWVCPGLARPPRSAPRCQRLEAPKRRSPEGCDDRRCYEWRKLRRRKLQQGAAAACLRMVRTPRPSSRSPRPFRAPPAHYRPSFVPAVTQGQRVTTRAVNATTCPPVLSKTRAANATRRPATQIMRRARAAARAAQPANTVRSTSLVARAAPPPPRPQAIASPRATAQQLTVPACTRRYGIACLQQRRHHDVEHVLKRAALTSVAPRDPACNGRRCPGRAGDAGAPGHGRLAESDGPSARPHRSARRRLRQWSSAR